MPNQRPPKQQSRRSKPQQKKKGRGGRSTHPWVNDLIARMDECPTAEALNDQVITPMVQALVNVCDARGYVFNIYGDHCNLVITPEEHAESIYKLINAYMDESDL